VAKYVRHFLEEAIGAQPPGISFVYNDGTIGGSGPFVAVATPASTPKYIGDRYLAEALISTTVGYRSAFGFDDVNADAARADVQIMTRVANKAGGSNTKIYSIGARCSGTYSSWTGYFFEMRRTDDTHMTAVIVKGVTGTDTDLATSSSLAMNTGTPYFLRLECRGTNLKMKVWTGELTDEPGAWTLTVSDSAIAAAGSITYGGKVTVTSANVGGIGMEFLCVGTGTDDAPPAPKTWAEYLAFLGLQDALHCVLIEIDPLGQDSTGAALQGRVCMANLPFVSRPEDRYPNICYEEILLEPPKNRRRMNELLRGRSTMTYGDIVFANEVVKENAAGFTGRLEQWFTWNWDGRPIRELIGHPTWRRCDFRSIFYGAVQSIERSGYGKGLFKIKGLEGTLLRPLTTATIGGSGPNASALMPSTRGFYFNVDVTSLLYDAATLTYQVCKPGSNDFAGAGDSFAVRDSGGSLNLALRTISAVNTGTDTLTADAAHGLVANATVLFTGGSPPSPLFAGQKYYVVTAGLTSTDFRLSLTKGGATIDITTATTGASFRGRLYDFDDTTGRISLVSNPAGRVTVDAGFLTSIIRPYQAIAGLGFGGGFTFDAYHGAQPPASNPPQSVADWTQAQRTSGDEIDLVYQSVGAAWQFTRDGSLYAFVLDIPGAATLPAIGTDDIRNWQPGVTLLPADVERLGYAKNFAIQKDGLLSTVTPTNRDLYGKPYSLTGYTPTETGLEQPANHLLRRSPKERETLLTIQSEALAESQRLYNLYRKTCATRRFETDAWAFTAELGDVLPITYPRDGFENGKNAVIIGIGNEDAARGTLELEIFFQVDGAWPVVSAAQPFIPETYY
jgi:hypothetical protein